MVAAETPHGTAFSALLPIFNVWMDEPNEAFRMAISASGGGATTEAPMGVTIVDPDAPSTDIELDLTLAQQTVNERAGSVPVSVRVITVNGQPTTTAVPLNFAKANVDYAHLAGVCRSRQGRRWSRRRLGLSTTRSTSWPRASASPSARARRPRRWCRPRRS